jgi:hypothetical protein
MTAAQKKSSLLSYVEVTEQRLNEARSIADRLPQP